LLVVRYWPVPDALVEVRIESARALLLKAGVILSRSSSTLLSEISLSIRDLSSS
jgi:hypothetical protein